MARSKAQTAGETTPARILIDNEFGRAGVYAEIPSERVADLVAQNMIDIHPDAVAYAKAGDGE